MPLEDLVTWYTTPKNLMLTEGDNVGLATYEYPGLYDVHWYYRSARGRDAINLGKRMVGVLFEHHGAEVLRGLIKVRLKASRWACRQLGFKSQGILTYPDGDVNEIFVMTKADYMEGKGN